MIFEIIWLWKCPIILITRNLVAILKASVLGWVYVSVLGLVNQVIILVNVWGNHLVCIRVIWLIVIRDLRVVEDLFSIVKALRLILVVFLILIYIISSKVVPVELLVKLGIDLAQDFYIWSLGYLELILVRPSMFNLYIYFLHVSMIRYELPCLPWLRIPLLFITSWDSWFSASRPW